MNAPPPFSSAAITFSNGTIVPDATTSTGWRYKIAVRDHLGNTRAVISDLNDDGVLDLESSTDPSELLSIHNYSRRDLGASTEEPLARPNPAGEGDPFGLEMQGPWMQSHPASMDYLYNSKEFNFRGSLGWYDYGARWYDPTIGRWNAVDPLADHPNQIGMSPYSAMWNNPIYWTDPDGLCPDCPEDAKAGDIFRPEGANHDYLKGDDGLWTMQGGDLAEITVTATRLENNGGMMDFSNSNIALTVGGAIYGGLEGASASQGYWLGNNGKYYPQQWGGNQTPLS